MGRYFEVKRKESKNEKADWRTLIKFNDRYAKYRQKFMTMLEKYGPIWDGHIGRTNVTKHRMELIDKNTQSIYKHRY